MRDYYAEIDGMRTLLMADFDFHNSQQSAIDKRLNVLGKRGDITQNADEIEALLKQRQVAKSATLSLLPLRDLFKNGWTEVGERMEHSKSLQR